MLLEDPVVQQNHKSIASWSQYSTSTFSLTQEMSYTPVYNASPVPQSVSSALSTINYMTNVQNHINTQHIQALL